MCDMRGRTLRAEARTHATRGETLFLGHEGVILVTMSHGFVCSLSHICPQPKDPRHTSAVLLYCSGLKLCFSGPVCKAAFPSSASADSSPISANIFLMSADISLMSADISLVSEDISRMSAGSSRMSADIFLMSKDISWMSADSSVALNNNNNNKQNRGTFVERNHE